MIKKRIKYSIIALFVGLVIIQFIARPEKLAEPLNPNNDMISLLSVEGELKTIFQNVCYDCHSNQPNYPWYSNIAPLSWLIDDHMKEGREELNFSDWGTFTKKRRDHKLEEMIEEVEANEMPLPSYRYLHWDAKLDDQQIALLKKWVINERARIEQEN